MNVIIYQCHKITLRVIDYIYLNEDIMNHIMLYCPISIIRRYLQTCKMSHKLLNNHFWIKKFNHDQLPILYYQYELRYPADIYWIKEYIKCYNIINEANELLYNFTLQSDYTKYISVKIKIHENISWLDEKFNNQIQKVYQYFYILWDDESHVVLSIENYNNQYTLQYVVYNDDLICFKISIPIITPKNFLIKLMYYLSDYKFKLV